VELLVENDKEVLRRFPTARPEHQLPSI